MPEPHQDRRTGLVVFGAVQILLGCLSILLLLQTAALPQVNVAQTLLFWSLAVFYFVATGVGSIRARRWARALIAAVSAIWTVVGVISFAVVLIAMPHLMVVVRPSQESAMKATLLITIVAVMVLLPLVLTLFYASRDTALTCDERDPKFRWTDRVPVPVLALCTALAFSAVEMLMHAGQPTYMFFGRLLSGAPAALAMIALAILFAHVAIQMYRLREYAWWVVVLLHVLTGAMWAVRFGRMETTDFVQNATPQVRAMHLEQLLRSPALWTIVAAGWIAYLAFLIWLRRYFVGRGEEAPAPLLSTST